MDAGAGCGWELGGGCVGHVHRGSPPPDAIFADGFASGTLAAWSAATNLTAANVRNPAALHGSDPYGLRVAVRGGRRHFLTDTTPAAEPSYHARFYLDPNATATGAATWTLFAARNSGAIQLFALQLTAATGSTPQLRLTTRSKGVKLTLPWVAVSDAPHAIEIAWSATTRTISLSVDGVVVSSRNALVNTTQRLEDVRLGPSVGLAAGATGLLYFDDFVSTRTATIGP